MGLLDPTQDTTTPAQRAAARIRESVRQSGRMVLQTYTVCYNDLWHNVEGATPEQINAELGVDAGPCMAYAVGIVGQLYPQELLDLPASYSYSVNPDGSLTLTYTGGE